MEWNLDILYIVVSIGGILSNRLLLTIFSSKAKTLLLPRNKLIKSKVNL